VLTGVRRYSAQSKSACGKFPRPLREVGVFPGDCPADPNIISLPPQYLSLQSECALSYNRFRRRRRRNLLECREMSAFPPLLTVKPASNASDPAASIYEP
jgi:hypothetical protein